MRQIEEIKSTIKYDKDTGVFTWLKDRRHGVKKGMKAGSIDWKGYLKIYIKGRSYYAHRLAWLLFYGSWPEKQLDHINRNKGDNRISNLRLASNAENQANVGVRSDSRTGIKGVGVYGKKYVARIRVNGKRVHLGYFDDQESAKLAYENKAKAVMGDFYPRTDSEGLQ